MEFLTKIKNKIISLWTTKQWFKNVVIFCSGILLTLIVSGIYNAGLNSSIELELQVYKNQYEEILQQYNNLKLEEKQIFDTLEKRRAIEKDSREILEKMSVSIDKIQLNGLDVSQKLSVVITSLKCISSNLKSVIKNLGE